MVVSAFLALQRPDRRPSARDAPSEPPSALTQALTASLIGFVVGAFFLSLAYSEILYTLMALAVGLQKVKKARTAAPVGRVRLPFPQARHS